MASPGGYLSATRHPWPCLLFVLPLLAAYEYGVLVLGGTHPEALRNGADNWLRCGLTAVGLSFFWLPPAVLLVVLLLWAWRRRGDRPGDLLGVLTGMAIESVTFALGLWALSRGLAPLLDHFGVELAFPPSEQPAALPEAEPALRQVVTYLGAGIYEESLFRLVLFSGLMGLLRRMDLGGPVASLLAALASATLFATAHHIGPYGQPYSNYLFVFRLSAGLYFAALYQARGFGIAVASHACYNVMISVGAG
jgi:hypothetical protein